MTTNNMDKFNAAIRTTIGDLVVQAMQANAQLEQAIARIAELEAKLAEYEPEGAAQKINGAERSHATQ